MANLELSADAGALSLAPGGAWLEALARPWITKNVPGFLQLDGPAGLAWWQWLGVGLVILVATSWGSVTSALGRGVLSRAVERSRTMWDNRLLERSGGPLWVACSIAYASCFKPVLLLHETADDIAGRTLRGLFLADVLWLFWRALDVGAELAFTGEWSRQHPSSRALIPLARRAGKTFVMVAAVVLFLGALGYPVTTLMAGLGIGGLALALASQKTVENLFGAFSLGIDQPFREGDFVRVEDLVGTVESLGLRSTKVRTLDRTLVSFPNGKLAEMRLETFAARDRLRLACTVGLVYETTQEQMRQVLAGFEQVLRSHPQIWPEVVNVRFSQFGAFSLDVEIMAWFSTSDWGEFLSIRQEVLLAFMRVVEEAGTAFAFPTQTVHLMQ